MTPADLVTELLRTLEEAQTSWDPRSGGGGPILMPTLYHDGSYRELQDRLSEMRDDRGWRRPWWHVSYRYRWGRVIRTTVKARKTARGPEPILPARSELLVVGSATGDGVEVRLYVWPEYVDDGAATAGVARLVATMYDGDTTRLRLPEPFLWRRLGLPAPDERERYVPAR